MNTEANPPEFPGKELLGWTKHLLKEFGQLLLKGERRVQAVPKEKWLSAIAIFGMFVLVLFVGTVVGFLLLAPLFWGAVFAAVTIAWLVFTLVSANNLKLTLLRAKRAEETYPEFAQTVRALAKRAGIAPPSVWTIENEQPNAFVCGRSPSSAALVVHTAGLSLWTDEELEGILAHEVAHIKNHDVLASTVSVALYESLTWICRVYLLGLLGAVEWYEKLTEKSKSALSIVFLACSLLGWVVFWLFYGLFWLLIRPASLLLSLAASRQKEFLADRTAAILLGSSDALAEALLAIERSQALRTEDPEEVQSAQNAGDTAADKKKKRRERYRFAGGWENVWSTHPPTAKRVELLRALGLQEQTKATEV